MAQSWIWMMLIDAVALLVAILKVVFALCIVGVAVDVSFVLNANVADLI